jgi:hypothetical protein
LPADRIVNARLTEEEAAALNQLLTAQGFSSLADLLRTYVKGPVPKSLLEPLADTISEKVIESVKQLFYREELLHTQVSALNNSRDKRRGWDFSSNLLVIFCLMVRARWGLPILLGYFIKIGAQVSLEGYDLKF